ncbi:MAG: anion permease, partial [Mitsuokella jalaludinii]|nr:anion permease [Mitsuokella jalaludinii]
SGLQPFGFFEFAWIGIPLSIAGVIYMLTIGRRLCPHEHIDSNLSDLTSDLPKDTRKMAICATILVLVVIAMALSKTINVPMQTAAVIGALACVITGCLSEKQAYGGIDWTTIFLFAGMLPLAEAMDKTGAGAMIANSVVSIIGSNASPLIIVMALFLLSCGLTQFMSNTAAAALLAPIGISIAQSIGVSPFPVLMAIGIAASCAFTTPVATPPNTLVLAPGKFHFMDYVKVGLPLVVVSMIVCTVIIPLVWPF